AAELTVIDGKGLWLWPGLVDAHVHLREPGFPRKETIRSGSLAAAAGGYTSVICEPNTEPPIASAEAVRALAEQADREAAVHVYFKAAMTKGRAGAEPNDVASLAAEERIVALSDDGDPIVEAALMERICERAADCDILLAPHCEDSPRALAALAAGAEPGFDPAAPYENEANYVERDLRMAERCGCRIHFSHLSMGRSVRAVRAAAEGGTVRATCEVTPHHLLLAQEDFLQGEAPAVNPPLRSRQNAEALCGLMLAGQVDAIASDHAPHTEADKQAGASGLIGLETTLGLVLTQFVGPGRLSPARAVRLLSLAPAGIFALPAGTLHPGSRADLVLIDPHREWTVDPTAFRSRSRNTPFASRRLRGAAVATYVSGREAFAAPGFEERKTCVEP
ncbi:MAG: dihydroorotase, partial [Planctomycetota bacterium]